jgi:hypothetical protein
VVYGNFNYNFPLFSGGKNRNFMLFFSAKGCVMVAEWSACVPTAHVLVSSRRKFEKLRSKVSSIQTPF